MLKSHAGQIDTTAMEQARKKNENEQLRGDKREVSPWDGQRYLRHKEIRIKTKIK